MGTNEKAWGIGFKRMIGDPSLGNGETYGICVDETVRQIHVCDIGDAGTDWARSVSSHPELCIHSATTPESYYLKMYTSGATAYIDAVGATTLSILIAGTAELALTSSAFSPGVTNSSALGTTSLQWSDLFLASGGVINFNGDEITMTHSTIGTGGKIKVETTWGTAAALGRPFEVSLIIDDVRLGSYANAFKAIVDCGASGGSQGVLSASNHEMDLPTTAGGEGVYTCVEHEMVAPEGFNSSGCILSWMYFNAGGTDVADIYAVADLFHIDSGVVAGASSTLSANSQTLRIGLGANAGTKRYMVLSSTENILHTNVSAVAADGRMARIQGTIATPAMSAGYGTFEVELSVGGTGTGNTAVASTWMNVGSGKTLASGANQLLHTDGFWEDSGATITGAHMAMCRYEAILGDSDFNNLNIFQLNFTQTLDAIFDVNDPAKALGYVAGGAGGGAVGSIPIFTVGASAVKYIYIYDAA